MQLLSLGRLKTLIRSAVCSAFLEISAPTNKWTIKGPSTQGEEFVDEVSTKSQRRNFNLILIFFCESMSTSLIKLQKKEFRRKN